jgi:hypothetical protein
MAVILPLTIVRIFDVFAVLLPSLLVGGALTPGSIRPRNGHRLFDHDPLDDHSRL